MYRWFLGLGLSWMIFTNGVSTVAHAEADATKAVGLVLDQFHQAAAKADGGTYFALFAPEGVFIGTDATERWTVEEFKQYAQPHFAKGKGWTYVPKDRHVNLAPGAAVAWFDEILENQNYGVCRGSGVLRKIAGQWRISQYHLTIPVPNALAETLVKLMREQPKAAAGAKK